MAKCINCWWADFSERAPGRHVIITEPDFLGMKHPDDTPAEIRVVKFCFKGQPFAKTIPAVEQGCQKFDDAQKMQEIFDKTDAKRSAEWSNPTSRTKLPYTKNFFEALSIMQEGNDVAFEILVDLSVLNEVAVSKLVYDLDDMNMRGDQIELAYEFAHRDIDTLITLASERDEELVAFVNQHYDKAETERAVIEGASRYGHTLPKRVEPKTLGRRSPLRLAPRNVPARFTRGVSEDDE